MECVITPEADEVFEQRGRELFFIPDILCNAGGAIVSYFEWVRDLQRFFWDECDVADKLYRALEKALQSVLDRAAAGSISHRKAAMTRGVETVRNARTLRGLFP